MNICECIEGLGSQDRVDMKIARERILVSKRALTMYIFGNIKKKLTAQQCELLAKLKLQFDGDTDAVDCMIWNDASQKIAAEVLANSLSQKVWEYIFRQDAATLWERGIIPQSKPQYNGPQFGEWY